MKKLSFIVIVLALLCSCINNPLDSRFEDYSENDKRLRSLVSKSVFVEHEDSLTMMSKLQKDENFLMMSRIVFKDSVYVLGIKRQDAIFLGVSEDVYDQYVEYVSSLNNSLDNI